MRKVHIQGKVWGFVVTRGMTSIAFPSPNQNKKFHIQNAQIKNLDQNSWERGQHKKTSDGMVTPSEVKAYIEKRLSQLVAGLDEKLAKQKARKKK